MSLTTIGLHGVVSATQQTKGFSDFHVTVFSIKTETEVLEISLYHKDRLNPILPFEQLPFKDVTRSLQSEST